jgi:selenoprotein W-related protein
VAEELFDRFGQGVENIVLIPSHGGVFEVEVNDALVFSKKELRRHAEPGEVSTLVARLLGASAPT